MPEPRPDLSPKTWDEVNTTTCYMCACRCGIEVHLKDGQIRYIEGNPRPPGQPRRAVRQGLGRHHAALLAGAAAQAAAARRRARRRRVPRDRLGRGAGARHGMAGADPRTRDPDEARLLHRPRPVAVADRLLGAAVRHAATTPPMAASARSTWRPPASTRSAARSGSSASPTGSAPSYFLLFGVAEDHDSNPIKLGPRQAQGARRQVRLGQPGAHRLFGRSPTNGSASAPAPTGCSCSR